MESIRLLIFILTTVFIGHNVLSVLSVKGGRLCLAERLALSYGIGLGFSSLWMLILYCFNCKFTPANILAPWLLLFIFNAFRRRAKTAVVKKAPNAPEPVKYRAIKTLLIFGISFEVVYAFFRALIKPMESYDAIAIYAIKAKVFYLASSIPADFFTNLALSLPHPDYPLNIPLSEALCYLFMGSMNDQLVKVIFPLYFAGILTLIYFAVRRFSTRLYALLFTFLLATVTQFNNYATNGYLDLPLAYYVSASAIFLYMYFEDRSREYYLISAVMAGLACWTKNEGLMYFGINMFVIFLLYANTRKALGAKSCLKHLSSYAVIVLLVYLPWLWIKYTAHLSNDEISLSNFNPVNIAGQWRRIWPILYEFQKQFLGPKKWNLIWILFIYIFAVNFKASFSAKTKYVTVTILLAFFGYILVYMVTSQDIRWHVSTTASRFFIHFLPIVVYWLAVMMKDKIDI